MPHILGHFYSVGYSIEPIFTPNPKSIIALIITTKVMWPRSSFDLYFDIAVDLYFIIKKTVIMPNMKLTTDDNANTVVIVCLFKVVAPPRGVVSSSSLINLPWRTSKTAHKAIVVSFDAAPSFSTRWIVLKLTSQASASCCCVQLNCCLSSFIVLGLSCILKLPNQEF